jgi:hypothetical protein
MFRRALQGQEQVLGDDHRDTLNSVHWLGLCFYNQHRFTEAEAIFRRAFQGREKVLGHDDKATLSSKQFMELSYEHYH